MTARAWGGEESMSTVDKTTSSTLAGLTAGSVTGLLRESGLSHVE